MERELPLWRPHDARRCVASVDGSASNKSQRGRVPRRRLAGRTRASPSGVEAGAAAAASGRTQRSIPYPDCHDRTPRCGRANSVAVNDFDRSVRGCFLRGPLRLDQTPPVAASRGAGRRAHRGGIARRRPEPPAPAAPKQFFEAAVVKAATEHTLVVPSEAWIPSAPPFP